jgi:septin family protein
MGVPPVSPGGTVGYECSFKILLIGDSGVGKSSLLVSFVAAASLDDDIAPTIGTFFTPIVRAQADKPIAASLCLFFFAGKTRPLLIRREYRKFRLKHLTNTIRA